MADRTVSVRLRADVRSYVDDVAKAAAATKRLRLEAEKFQDRYRASVDVTGAEKATAETRAARREGERFDGQTFTARVNVRDAGKATRQIGAVRSSLRGLDLDMRALKVPAIGAAAVAATPALAGATADVRRLLGVAGLLPAVMLGAGAAIATVAAGTRGFTKAVSDGGAALDELAPSARAAAEELRGQAGAWKAVQVVIQNRLFAGMADRFDALGREYLPVVVTAAADLAGQLNEAADAFAAFALEADSVRDSQHGLEQTRLAASRLAPIVTNLSRIFKDVAVVGSEEFPRLALGIELVTDRWRRLVAESRADGRMAEWITDGIEQAKEFGRILGNTAGIMGAVADAADTAGIDVGGTLDRLTAKAERFLSSAPGQDGMIGFFRELEAAGEELVPGLEAIGGAVANVLDRAGDSGVLREAASALSALAVGAAPVVETLGELTSTVLPPLLRMVGDLAPALGPAAGAFVGLRLAAGGLSKIVTPAAAGLGTALVGSAAGGTALAGAASTLITRIPIMGAVIAAAIGTINALEISADDAGRVIAQGGLAADRMRESYAGTNDTLRAFVQGIPILGAYLSGVVDDQDDLTRAVTEYETQQRNVNNAVLLADQQLRLYNDTVKQFGANSPQAAYAADQYKLAVGDLERAQAAAGVATEGHTLALTRQRDQFLGSVAAGIAWKESINRASESIKTNGVNIDVNTQAGQRNQRALLDMARAAFADIDAQREHGASTQTITALTKDHEGQLFNTARQMGMSEGQARDYVNQLRLTPTDQTTNFHTPGLPQAIAGVKELVGLINGLQDSARSNLTGAVGDALDATRRRTGRAMGGPLRGPGTGTSDSIPVWGSNGEWVIRERVTREQGDDRMALLNAGMGEIVPRGQARAYATGGPIGGHPTRNVTLDFRGAAELVQQRKNEWFPPMPMGGGGGAQQWAGVASQALAMLGQSQALLPRVLQQIQIESSGNPRAINLWDINARRGTPSKGLIQTIDSTYAANADPRRNLGPYDPLSNLLAGIRYAIRRYGSIASIWPTRAGYADGGTIPGTGTRDDKFVLAQSGERVLTRTQNRDFERLVDVLERPTPIGAIAGAVRGGDGPSTFNYAPHQEITLRESVDLDLFNQRQDFAIRAVAF